MVEQGRDFLTDKASKMFGIPYDKITEEQRAEAKKLLLDYLYCRSDNNPFKGWV